MISREDAESRAAQYAALITGKVPEAFEIQVLDEWEYGWFFTYTLAGLPSPDNELLGAYPLSVEKLNGRVTCTEQYEEIDDFKAAFRNMFDLENEGRRRMAARRLATRGKTEGLLTRCWRWWQSF